MQDIAPMNKSLAALLFATLVGLSQADTKFPKGTLEPKDLEKAKTQAAAAKKSIAFVLTDKATTCPLCQGAAAAFIDVLKSKAIIIFVNSEDPSAQSSLPAAVTSEFNNGGNHIPKVVVTDATAEKTTASITYDTYKVDERKSLREFKKAL